jgi:gluconolactonase
MKALTMKHFLLALLFIGQAHFLPAQINRSIRQKEAIAFPEWMVCNEAFYKYFSPKNKIEKIVSGKHFPEGPVWVAALNGLLFTDIPANKIYFWSEQKGLSVWLQPSGFANGLELDASGNLMVMQGNHLSTATTRRQVGKIINPAHNKKITGFITNYEGKKFNSPNDTALHPGGSLYFTDPVYGLINGNADKEKELSYNGVYRFKNNKTLLIIDSLQSPNGIGVAPNGKHLYISDSETGRLLCYALNAAGDIVGSVPFFNVPQVWELLVSSSVRGWDGLAVSRQGVIVASGCGGLWFFSPWGILLAHIQTPDFTSNVAFDDKEEYIYWTAGKLPFSTGSGAVYRSKIK